MARTTLAEQEGPGMYGTGADTVPAAQPPKDIAAARDPASLAAVYGNVQRSYAAALAPAADANEAGRQELYSSTVDTNVVSAPPFDTAVAGAAAILAADVTSRIPPGFQLFLNATSAVIAPIVRPPNADASPVADATGADADGSVAAGHVGSPGVYVYDKPDAPPPGVKPAAAALGFAGAADWL